LAKYAAARRRISFSIGPVYAALKVPALTVNVVIIGLKYGFGAVFDRNDARREPDSMN
jgi:hypothetical protein